MNRISNQTRLIVLFLFPVLCAFLPPAVLTERAPTLKASPLTFTLETKDKTVGFFEPLSIRVVLRNNSRSSLSLNPKNLRLIPFGWHVVGTNGAWMEGEGLPLKPEDPATERIQLAAGASVRLLTLEEHPTFELLGPVRVAYKLNSTDPATKKLLPTETRELVFEIPPTKLISAVWTANTQSDRALIQKDFNKFLNSRATVAAALEKEDGDFGKRRQDMEFGNKSLFYMAGYALPFLLEAARDKDPLIRERSLPAYSYAARAVDQLDDYLDELDKLGPRPQWAATLNKNHNRDQADWRSFALRALNDPVPAVRIAAVTVLTKTDWDQYWFDASGTSGIGSPKSQQQSPSEVAIARELEAVKALSKDPDARVRAAVQKYLVSFADKSTGVDTVAEALIDTDPTVRKNALDALLRSPQPPPLETLKRAFAFAKGETAAGLIPLLLEQEDESLATTLGTYFTRRSEEERLAVMTAIAGHSDAAALELIKSGLYDPSTAIQRAAVMRVLPFAGETAKPLIEMYLQRAPAELRPLAEAVKTEIETRRLWPFLKTATSASESAFPSRNGTKPITSPDGEWIAYEETGWGRPGGSGGLGSSNLLSITHVVSIKGTDDRVVSDMCLVTWLSDSKRVGTARDGFVAITDFNGDLVAEFGNPGAERYRYSSNKNPIHWTKGELRAQFGEFMPHRKHLDGSEEFGFGAGGSFSPDGKWYGPLEDRNGKFLLDTEGQRIDIKFPKKFSGWLGKAIWSPDGRYVQLTGDNAWLIIHVQTRRSTQIENISSDGCVLAECRANPWSSDSARLLFVREGQIWMSDTQGKGAKQLTFDNTRKASPSFSRDGRLVAYLTWQPNNRRHYPRLGPTNLWVIDVATTLVTRVTAPAPGRINSFDWLDDRTLIFDRYDQKDDYLVPSSTLRRLSM